VKRLAAFGGILILIATLQAQGLGDLYRPRAGVSRRVSSYDRTGGNQDTVELKPGEKRPLADIAGSGVVRHIWMTINSQDPSYLRSLVIRFFWDGEREPSIEVPVGDLFGLGHGVVADFNSAPISVVRAPHLADPPGRGALNLFFPMPFSTRAQIEMENQSPAVTCVLYYYVDYDALPRPPDSTLRFHAVWRQELLAVPAGIISSPGNVPDPAAHKLNSNTTGKANYVVLDAKGRGHYVGCVLSVDSRGTDAGKWWEGDDMIFVDDDTWPPSIHGTGTEDYFSLAWGFRGLPTRLYHGTVLLEKRPTDPRVFDGRFTAYRFHIEDAIVFQKALRVTLEHGHANDAGVRYASTAYWYQTEPHTRQPALPPRGSRGWSQ
jgi:D-arabinan exo alpha-(1,3)/(1,5)-arabinofuranosidase (non-reducing end)